ncbi:MAG: hypothetical protein Ct9H90mP1_1900 [Methanobacteriota archaeon]|nr:MAG: hypothetical protein Ct9H90mP1_1900 [Euryarchaeota archaeon]
METRAQRSVRIVETPVRERAPNAIAATYEDACRRLSCSSRPCLMSDTAKRSRTAEIRSADGSWRPDISTAGVDQDSMDRSSVKTSFFYDVAEDSTHLHYDIRVGDVCGASQCL